MLKQEKYMPNNCFLNQPNQIFCRRDFSCTGNEVVNPVLTNNFAYFNNLQGGTIVANGAISQNYVRGSGLILSDGNSGVLLPAGDYQITFNVSGTALAGQEIAVALSLNDLEISGSRVTGLLISGGIANLNQTLIVTIQQTSNLKIVNYSSESVQAVSSSLSIVKL